MKELRPNYYKDKRGHDIFWKMENRHYPYAQCIGFCRLNAEKYKQRAGSKPGVDPAIDQQKAATYIHEMHKLRNLKQEYERTGMMWP